MTTIRPATTDDLPSIVHITNWAIDHTHAHFATTHWTLDEARAEFDACLARHPWFVAIAEDLHENPHDDQIIGYAKCKPWNPRGAYADAAEISAYILPDHHGRGVGKALYAQLIPAARARALRTLIAGIALPNDASVRLHEAIGMTHVGTFTRIGVKHAVWHDVGYWQMHLD
jgi:phosphinothricin acetyltransferase